MDSESSSPKRRPHGGLSGRLTVLHLLFAIGLNAAPPGLIEARAAGDENDCPAKSQAAAALGALAADSDDLTASLNVRGGRLQVSVTRSGASAASQFIINDRDGPLEWDVALDDIDTDQFGLGRTTYPDFNGFDLRLVYDPRRNGNSVSDPYFTGWLKIPFLSRQDAERAVALLRMLKGPCGERQARPSEPRAPEGPRPIVASCPDGSRIPATGVCPTITFPGRGNAPPAAASRNTPPPAPPRAAAPPVPEPLSIADALASLRAAAPVNRGRGLSPLMQRLVHPVDIELDRTVSADPGSPVRPSLLKRVWEGVLNTAERSVNWIPGCREDLFSRNVCRISMFGPFYLPGATRDLNDTISEVVDGQLGP